MRFESLWRDRGSPPYGSWAHPYYVFAPDYRHTSAGVRVLHYLCHILNGLGLEAYITPGRSAADLRAPSLTKEIVARHASLGLHPIAVYPETAVGNPLNANVVVRYVLYYPGHYEYRLRFMPWELVFSFLDDYVPDGIAHQKLFVPTSDTALFNSAGTDPGQRTLTAFYANRFLASGEPQVDLPAGTIEISPRVPARSLAELAAIFRKARILYSYEWSAVCVEAMLCGCPVALVPNRYLDAQYASRPKSLAHLPLFHELHEGNGICVGLDEPAIRRAAATVGKFGEVYARKSVESLSQLDTFVRLTQANARRTSGARWLKTKAPDTETAGARADPGAAGGPVQPVVVLGAHFDQFGERMGAGVLAGAQASAMQIDQLLQALMIRQPLDEPAPAARRVRADAADADDEVSVLNLMLKMPGCCFLTGQHLMTIAKTPEAAVPWFRLAAALCDSNLGGARLRFAAYETLMANAMYSECVALKRASRIADMRSRLDEMMRRSWSDPVALRYVERGRSALERFAAEEMPETLSP